MSQLLTSSMGEKFQVYLKPLSKSEKVLSINKTYPYKKADKSLSALLTIALTRIDILISPRHWFVSLLNQIQNDGGSLEDQV